MTDLTPEQHAAVLAEVIALAAKHPSATGFRLRGEGFDVSVEPGHLVHFALDLAGAGRQFSISATE